MNKTNCVVRCDNCDWHIYLRNYGDITRFLFMKCPICNNNLINWYDIFNLCLVFVIMCIDYILKTFFPGYAGQTKETLIFDSRKGIISAR